MSVSQAEAAPARKKKARLYIVVPSALAPSSSMPKWPRKIWSSICEFVGVGWPSWGAGLLDRRMMMMDQ